MAILLARGQELSRRSRSRRVEKVPASQIQRLDVISSVPTPHGCNLVYHWIEPSNEGMRYLQREVKRWRFPDEFEDASRCLTKALAWARRNLESTIFENLERFEKHLQPLKETGSSAPGYDGMSKVRFRSQGHHSSDGTLQPGEEPPIGCLASRPSCQVVVTLIPVSLLPANLASIGKHKIHF